LNQTTCLQVWLTKVKNLLQAHNLYMTKNPLHQLHSANLRVLPKATSQEF